MVFGRAQAQFLGSKVAYGLAVHGVVHRFCARHHLYAGLFVVEKSLGAYGFYFGHDDVGTVFAHYFVQFVAVKHAEHLIFVGHLHGWSTCVAVAGHYILAGSLGCYYKLFAQFAGA